MKNNRGFTLVELLVAISLLAILTVIAIPTLRAFQANNDKKTYENYGKSIATSAKLYNDSYSDDLFGNLENGCEKVTLTEMINKKVAKDITLKDVTCNKPEKDSYVLVWKYNDEYAFDPVVNCENSKGASQYNDNEALAESCVSATGKPYITVNTVSNEANNTKKKSVIINLNDDFGFTANQEIEYAWSTINNDNGAGVTGYKTYKFNNSYIKRTSGTVILKTNSITIPSEETGTYYLYVKPVKVQNIINESITNIHKFGPYRFDHHPPTCPTIKAYKADGSEVAKETATSISSFKITYSADDLQNYELQISYDNGTNWSAATTYSKDKDSYTPTKDGKIIIKTRAKDYANNQSDWCTSDMYIRDTTPPTAPTVIGYKKSNATDITSKGSLETHNSNNWLKGWIFTQASGSTDSNGVNYYYTTTGTTSNNSNVKASYRNINAEGESTVKYRACDNAGNCSGWTSYIAKLDRTAPTCGTATGASTTWTNSNRTIKQACSDSYSGCVKTSYDTSYSSTTVTDKVTISDKVSNTKECTYNVYIDKDPPSLSTSLKSNGRTIKSGQASSYDITLTLSASDTYNNPVSYYYSEAGKNSWTSMSNTYTHKEGKKTRDYKACDAIGNCTIKSNITMEIYGKSCGFEEFPENDDVMNMRVEPDWGKKDGHWCGQGSDHSTASETYGTCSSSVYYIGKGQTKHPELSIDTTSKWKLTIICDSASELSVPSGVRVLVSKSKDDKTMCYRSKADAGVTSGGAITKFIKVKVLVYDKSSNKWNPNLVKKTDLSKVNSKNDFLHKNDIEWINNDPSEGDISAFFYMSNSFFSVIC